jgi:putative DNA primase/helicase
MRVSGDELEPKLYSTWGPKVLAMIGKLPSTLADRSIEIPMKRKRPEERVARFRAIRPGNLPNIKRQCIRWAQDDLITLRDAALEVSVPEGLNDRAADNWEPLLTIADRVGGEWPDRARKAALALSGKGAAEDGSIGVMLLGDIKAIFEQRALNVWDWKRICRRNSPSRSPPWKGDRGRSGRASRLPRILWRACSPPFASAPRISASASGTRAATSCRHLPTRSPAIFRLNPLPKLRQLRQS